MDNPKEQGYPQSHTCLDNATRCPHIHSLRRCKRLIFQRSKDLKDKKTVRWISIFPAFSFKWITIFLASVDQYFSGAWITFFLTIATYGIKLGINNYIEVESEKYTGEYMFHPEESQTPYIVLTVFLIVVPDLFAIYDEEVENDNWNNSRKREFLNNIGETIQSRIQEKLGLSDS